MTAIKIDGDALQIVRAIDRVKKEMELKRRQLEAEFSARMSEFMAERQPVLQRHLSDLEALYNISAHGPGAHVLDTRYLKEHGVAYIIINGQDEGEEEPIVLSRELN